MGEENRPQRDIYLYIGIALSALLIITSLCVHTWVYNQHDNLEILVSSLAFIWLVIGYHQNNKAIRLQNEAIRLQAKEMNDSVQEFRQHSSLMQKTADIFEQQRKQSQRESYIKLYEIVFSNMSISVINLASNCQLHSFDSYNGKYTNNGNRIPGHNNLTRLISNMAHEILNKRDDAHFVDMLEKYRNIYVMIHSEYMQFKEGLKNRSDDVYLNFILLSGPMSHLIAALESIYKKSANVALAELVQ